MNQFVNQVSNQNTLTVSECHAYLARHNYGTVSNNARGWKLDTPQHDPAKLVYTVRACKTYKDDADWQKSVTVHACVSMAEGNKELMMELLHARISVQCCIMDDILAPQEIKTVFQSPPGVTREEIALALELLEFLGRVGGLSKRVAQYTEGRARE